jgi:hypothetical protein
MGIALFYVTVSGFFFGWDLRWGFVVLLWYLVVREWCYAWLMWSLNSHIFGVEQCAKFCNFIWLAAL